MITEVYLKNEITGVKVHISEANDDYVLQEMYFGPIEASITDYKAVGQVGSYISAIDLEPRTPYLMGWVVAPDYTLLEQRKSVLNSLVDPTAMMTIECYDTFRISGHPTKTIQYGKEWKENNDIMCKFMINWYCADPCFYEYAERSMALATWTGLFHFPLIIPEGVGIQFGHRQTALVGIIPNIGDIEIGMDITFEAVGDVSNPYILNLVTQEIIQLKFEMKAGDIIKLSTGFNQKTVTLYRGEDEPEDIFQAFVYPPSVFMQLHRGNNALRYGSDAGSDNLLIYISYMPQFLEVE